MAEGRSASLVRNLDQLMEKGNLAGMTDGELLQRFVSYHDESAAFAFEALVTRHGPTVLRLCRHILRSPNEADDAFQATFLVLVRKADSIRVDDSLGPWLYGVAYRVAVRARSDERKRRRREVSKSPELEPQAPVSAPDTFDLWPVLHEELNRLPEKYRRPIVLCHLEGKTHEEAAHQLHWPVGTLSGRLSRARALLRGRLNRRGLGISVSAFMATLTPRESAAVPLTLFDATVRTATQFVAGATVPASIQILTRGVLTIMLLNRIKLGLILVSTVSALVVTAGYLVAHAAGVDPPPAEPPRLPPQPPPAIAGLRDRPQPQAFVPKDIPGFPKYSEKSRKLQQDLAAGKPLERPMIPAMQAGSIIAVSSPDGRSWNAMSLDDGHWKKYTIPEGATVMPVMSPKLLALAISGPDVREFAIFNGDHCDWSRQPLREAVKGEFWPEVAPTIALYQVDNDFYAFSAFANRWDILHLNGSEKPKQQIGPTSILVLQGNKLHVFSEKLGQWSDGVDIKMPKLPK